MKRTAIYTQLLSRVREPRRFIQVLAGPRQVGKTTLARQVIEASGLSTHYASADEPTLRDQVWLEQQWDLARLKARSHPDGALLVIDEVQKVARWPEVVKLLWDTDSHDGTPLKVILLDSSPLLIQSGLTESLAGRFETIPVPHWSFAEMREAFGWNLEKFLLFGAYPGAAPLADDPDRWRQYINDSLIETTLSRDILLLTRVDKPALLRRLRGAWRSPGKMRRLRRNSSWHHARGKCPRHPLKNRNNRPNNRRTKSRKKHPIRTRSSSKTSHRWKILCLRRRRRACRRDCSRGLV